MGIIVQNYTPLPITVVGVQFYDQLTQHCIMTMHIILVSKRKDSEATTMYQERALLPFHN